jgi:hypothetical protein
MCALAAELGVLPLLKLARGQGCPGTEATCLHFQAAGAGQLDALQWARAGDCPWDLLWTCAAAAEGAWVGTYTC